MPRPLKVCRLCGFTAERGIRRDPHFRFYVCSDGFACRDRRYELAGQGTLIPAASRLEGVTLQLGLEA